MDGADHRSRERELGQITVEHFRRTEKGQASIYNQMISVEEQLASDVECNWFAGQIWM